MRSITYLLVIHFMYLCSAEAARILAHFMIPSISHQTFYQPVWRELSSRGHEVTVITTDPLDDPSLTNLKEINVNATYEAIREMNVQDSYSRNNSVFHNFYSIMEDLFLGLLEYELGVAEVQELIKLDENHFDLVIVEGLHPLIYGYGGKFKAPVVAITSIEMFLVHYDAFGNPTHPLTAPDWLAFYENEPTIYEKFRVLFYNVWSRALYYWHIIPKADALAKKYFGKDIPPLLDLVHNTSLLLVNRNPILHRPRANVPNIIEIGQLHLKDPKPLPKDLQQYLDNSTRGVVYFSLGTNVFLSTMNPSLQENIREALREIPYDVIWKFESDDMPGKPPNVLLRKWLPQQDLLRHPNIKAFVTQVGLQSLEESITSGVPMVGIPIIGDQLLNVKVLKNTGTGIGLDIETLTKDSLKKAIEEVAGSNMYKEQVMKYKRLLQDQPMNDLEKVVWWIEYVIRNKGADHLRSPAARLSFYEYFLLDVVVYLTCACCSLVYVFRRLLRLCSRFNNYKKKKE